MEKNKCVTFIIHRKKMVITRLYGVFSFDILLRWKNRNAYIFSNCEIIKCTK